jgi:hypothetical protein
MGLFGFNSNGKAVIGSTLLVPNVSYKDIPVTITSWSYVTTTITLNVASHTFVAGDYIEVGGLTATTNIPNGVHLVTSVTPTTIVFTYALTPTGTAGVSSATVKGYMTTNGRVESIAVGQTWVNVTGSRATDVLYTNSTGKPIAVSIRVAYNGYMVSLQVAGIDVSSASNGEGSLAGDCAFVIVPNGATYKAVSMTEMLTWAELR